MFQLRLIWKLFLDIEVFRNSKILNIHRLNKRTIKDGKAEYIPSKTLRIKFADQILLREVFLFKTRHEVHPFIPRICFACYRVEHIAKVCKGQPCLYCGGNRHEAEAESSCSRRVEGDKCINCKDSDDYEREYRSYADVTNSSSRSRIDSGSSNSGFNKSRSSPHAAAPSSAVPSRRSSSQYLNNVVMIEEYIKMFSMIIKETDLRNRAVGAGVYSPDLDFSIEHKLLREIFIFSAELWTILQATLLARDCGNKNIVILFSDSKSALNAINNNRYIQNNFIIYDVRQNILNASKEGIEITLFWVPSYLGIPGNEKTDEITKHASIEGRARPLEFHMKICSLNPKKSWRRDLGHKSKFNGSV
ncbi:PREDICTED: uncharacterized protein LOC105154856 [Acromyrmex echinatior]|uniref:uncharacterized protein LOC105154856 n=1 Tax=Acromyrmex echinatior TaxID=103372 RepID=UPI000580EECB|nr:PREDICTED: uncharacterized protein LOC105154856 [Acromyrmex echinatior]XP_011068925.1 PREDICTED: uncharacterized protein LOC105154856 [Acromyrmex echinatior]